MSKNPNSGVKKHVHKYMRFGPTPAMSYYIWKCVDGCAHFIHEKQEFYVVGRKSICWGCGEEFVMDEDAMKEEMPRCVTCRNPELNFDVDDLIRKRLGE
jgi:formylmethanofuran dehydrogenase subunit E